jgi:hypothetical protein
MAERTAVILYGNSLERTDLSYKRSIYNTVQYDSTTVQIPPFPYSTQFFGVLSRKVMIDLGSLQIPQQSYTLSDETDLTTTKTLFSRGFRIFD